MQIRVQTTLLSQISESALNKRFEGIFFFGLIIGWPNLAEILKVEGVYAEVCQTGNSSSFNCPERDELFSAVGTLGSMTMSFMVFPLGLLFDYYGSFVTR